MPWMTRWAGSFPLFVDARAGRAARRRRRPRVRRPVPRRHRRDDRPRAARRSPRRSPSGRAPGITTMLPSDDADLGRPRSWPAASGCRAWQFAMTATDANRFVLRFARHLTGRPRIAVMDWCYHGTVDETLAVLDGDRRGAAARARSAPRSTSPLTTAVVPFNDLDALDAPARRAATSPALLMEPALTNIGIVLPDDGYLDAVREITRRARRRCWSSTRRTRCAPGPAAARRRGVSSPTCWWSASRSAAASRCAAYGMTGGGRRPAVRADARATRSTSPASAAR